MDSKDFINLKPASSVKLIDFDVVEVRPGYLNDTYFLIVSGSVPCFNMDIRLSPYVYITCPEYWGIELTASLPGGVCLNAIKPFTLVLELSGITGSKGIEVIGATKSETIIVSGGCSPIN